MLDSLHQKKHGNPGGITRAPFTNRTQSSLQVNKDSFAVVEESETCSQQQGKVKESITLARQRRQRRRENRVAKLAAKFGTSNDNTPGTSTAVSNNTNITRESSPSTPLKTSSQSTNNISPSRSKISELLKQRTRVITPSSSAENKDPSSPTQQHHTQNQIIRTFQQKMMMSSPSSPTPHSPSGASASDSSSAYLRWPGTQDSNGQIYNIQSSYDDDDASSNPSSFLTNLEKEEFMKAKRNNASDLQLEGAIGSANFSPSSVVPSPVRNERKKIFEGRDAVVKKLSIDTSPQPPTYRAVAYNDSLSPSHEHNLSHRGNNVQGFCGYLDKTKDVPSLLDDTMDESDTGSSSKGTPRNDGNATPFDEGAAPMARIRQNYSPFHRTNQQIFKNSLNQTMSNERHGIMPKISHKNGNTESHHHYQQRNPNIVILPGGLTVLQTTEEDFLNRRQPADFDENLSNSDMDEYNPDYALTNRLLSTSASTDTMSEITGITGFTAANHNDNNHYHFNPYNDVQTKQKIVRPASTDKHHLYKGQNNESNARVNDAKGHSIRETEPKASGPSSSFGSQNRYDRNNTSRMDKDASIDLSVYSVESEQIEKLVRKFRKMCRSRAAHDSFDDLDAQEDAKKAFALSEMRSRIMETDIDRGLERRGGTFICDDLVLTPYHQAALRIRDAVIVSKAWRDGASPKDVITASKLMTHNTSHECFIERPSQHGEPTTFEEKLWVDDTDFTRLWCPSLGSRPLRGFEMFTISDCQSMLLKLTNEQCERLRVDLHTATTRQIEAEIIMKEEEEGIGYRDGRMTEAELTYLTTMEEVKTLCKKLVLAERAFRSVRDSIEELIARYEDLLVQYDDECGYDDESECPSSVVTNESGSYYSDEDDYSCDVEDSEKLPIENRAARATKLQVKIATREEASRTKMKNTPIESEKYSELKTMQRQSADIKSESHHTVEREHSVILAKNLTANSGRRFRVEGHRTNQPGLGRSESQSSKIDSIKQKFRDRHASRSKAGSSSARLPAPGEKQNKLTGEEMFQHLNFYERSLNAVKPSPKYAKPSW